MLLCVNAYVVLVLALVVGRCGGGGRGQHCSAPRLQPEWSAWRDSGLVVVLCRRRAWPWCSSHYPPAKEGSFEHLDHIGAVKRTALQFGERGVGVGVASLWVVCCATC